MIIVTIINHHIYTMDLFIFVLTMETAFNDNEMTLKFLFAFKWCDLAAMKLVVISLMSTTKLIYK